jgi:hypothetical protein
MQLTFFCKYSGILNNNKRIHSDEGIFVKRQNRNNRKFSIFAAPTEGGEKV